MLFQYGQQFELQIDHPSPNTHGAPGIAIACLPIQARYRNVILGG